MRTRTSVVRVVGIALLVAFACGAAGCGGGGGGGDGGGGTPLPPPADLFSGTYGFTSYAARVSGGSAYASRWGTWVSDGSAACSAGYRYNAETHTGTGNSDYTYELGVGRTVRLAQLGDDLARGGISAAGDVLALANVEGGIKAGLMLAVRPANPASDADLQGTYHGCSLEQNVALNKAQATVGTWTFDGAGTFTTTHRLNVGGLVTPAGTSGAWSYAVGGNGTVAFQTAAATTAGGFLHAGGDLVVLAGNREEGATSCLGVFVRSGSGMASSDLAGAYALVGLFFDVDALGWTAIEGRLEADGAGGWSATWRRNHEEAVTGPHTGSGAFTVDGSGLLTVAWHDGQSFEGGLAPDGRCAVFGGGVSDLSDPAVFVLLR